MPERDTFAILTRYFFARFFDNDVIEASGDTQTTIVRALAITAAPGLMLAFFLQNQYPQRTAWGRVEDHYFFVLYSALVMTGVAIFEWEALFPDRLDFLVLGPLPLNGGTMLAAKAAALGAFMGLFLFASNIFGAFILAAVSHGAFWRNLYAHALATAAAGVFGALLVVATGGVLLCALPARVFRILSPWLRMGLVTVLGLLLVHYVRFGDMLNKTLTGSLNRAGWVPTFWFLGVYERVLHVDAAAPFASTMELRAVWALAVATACVLVTYPLAWFRMQRMALESDGEARRRRSNRVDGWIALAVTQSGIRAVLPFIGQTMGRISKYQVYLAMYCGTGLALGIACAITFQDGMHMTVSLSGLHAVAPLLIFWLVAGLRMAFGLPLNLPARWVFRITGAEREGCIMAGRAWTMAWGLCLLALLMPILAWLGMGPRALVVQYVFGAAVCALIVDALMFSDRGIPFAQPRSPGKTSLPLMLTLFIGVLPVFVFAMVRFETWLESRLLFLLIAPVLVWSVHRLVTLLRRRSQPQLEDGDEIEPEFELLRLGVD